MKKKKETNRFDDLKKDVERFKAGKVKMQVTTVDPSTRASSVHYETYEEMKARHAAKERAVAEFKSLRKELGLSQGTLAQALRVPRRTLEGWEVPDQPHRRGAGPGDESLPQGAGRPGVLKVYLIHRPPVIPRTTGATRSGRSPRNPPLPPSRPSAAA